VLGLLTGAALAVACSGRDRPGAHSGDSAASEADDPRPAALLRVSLSPDSGSAATLADSLAREGWAAEVGPKATEQGQWGVNVLIPGDADLAKLSAHSLRQAGLEPLFVGVRPTRTGIAVAVIPVNRGTHGMSARVHWTLSEDRRALLVVEDPRGVEAEPLPNGFVFVREDARPVQRDSVWDVAASPDWRRVAYSRAFTTNPSESDSLPPSEWHRLAGGVGLMESIVRKNAFRTSGMVTKYGAARPFVVTPAAASDTLAPVADTLPVAEGWRLAWTTDGSRLAIGSPPDVITDEAPAARWRLVDPVNGSSRGNADTASLARPRWTEGPNLDASTGVDMKQRRAFRSGDVDIESEDGWIRVSARDGSRLRATRIIGPGIPLTATANGQFIVAIAPDPGAKSYDPPNLLVVYHLIRR